MEIRFSLTISEDEILRLPNISFDDAGRYECKFETLIRLFDVKVHSKFVSV